MISRFIAALLGATTIAASAIGTAGNAAAYPGGEIFFDNLRSNGIPVGSLEEAAKAANIVCDLIADGESYDSVIATLGRDTGMSDEQVSYFVEQSVLFFCRESTPLLPDVGSLPG